MKMTLVRTLPEEEWRHFVEMHPEGNIFQSPEMFQVFSTSKDYKPEVWAITKDNRILALFLPVQRTLINGLFHFLATRSVAYGSVLFNSDAEGQEALTLLLKSYKDEVTGSPVFTELRNLSNRETVQPIFNSSGFIYRDYLNFLINLERSPENVFQDFGRRTRKNIRNAFRKNKVTIEEVNEWDQVVTCYDLIRQSYQAAHVPMADLSLFKSAFNLLYPKGMIKFTLARVGQNPAAASVELLFKDTVYGWFGGMDRSYGAFIPNELLMWHILKWSSEKGYRIYDWGGAGSPDEEYGVRDFKAKFGGKLVNFGRNTYIHSPALLRLSRTGYSIMRYFL